MKVTGSELARKVGVDKSTISRLIKDGIIPADRDGKVELSEGLAALQAHEQAKQQGQKIATARGALQAKLLQEKIRGAKIDNDVKEGALVPLHDAKRVVTTAFHGVKSKQLAIPGRLAPLLVGLQPAAAEKLLRDNITKSLKELSEHEWITPQTCPHCGKDLLAQPDQRNQAPAGQRG